MSTTKIRAAAALAAALTTALLGACAMPAAQGPAASASASASAAPAPSIDPPAGTRALTLHASGVQVYACEFDAQHRLQWVFRNPDAVLYDASGAAILRHGAGPSWEAHDGSRIVGRVLAQRPSPNAASIPQLLLETHDAGAPAGLLAGVRYVQRRDTVGGTAPGAACASEHQVGSTPYLAEYVFYR